MCAAAAIGEDHFGAVGTHASTRAKSVFVDTVVARKSGLPALLVEDQRSPGVQNRQGPLKGKSLCVRSALTRKQRVTGIGRFDENRVSRKILCITDRTGFLGA